MEDTELVYGYLNWGAIMLTVYLLFNLLASRIKSSGLLFISTVGPAWLVATIIQGLIYYSLKNSIILFVPDGFVIVLFESLPSALLIGGLTFYYNNRRRSKKTLEIEDNGTA